MSPDYPLDKRSNNLRTTRDVEANRSLKFENAREALSEKN
jgi:hypothetical protein